MNTNFIRIGSKIINLALVAYVVENRDYDNCPVIDVYFAALAADGSAMYTRFRGDEVYAARAVFDQVSGTEEWAVVDGLNQRIR